jgi:hypothetical protein
VPTDRRTDGWTLLINVTHLTSRLTIIIRTIGIYSLFIGFNCSNSGYRVKILKKNIAFVNLCLGLGLGLGEGIGARGFGRGFVRGFARGFARRFRRRFRRRVRRLCYFESLKKAWKWSKFEAVRAGSIFRVIIGYWWSFSKGGSSRDPTDRRFGILPTRPPLVSRFRSEYFCKECNSF